MAQILRTTLDPAQALAAGAENFTWDLPVNPLSAILVTIRALNETSTLTNYNPLPALFAKISNLTVQYRGASIINGDSLDLAILYAWISGWWWKQSQINDTDNDIRAITFPLLFGRTPYLPMECFPASRRGDLVLSIATAADPTGLDNFELHLETIELLDATPEKFIKITTTSDTFAAGAVNELDLPIGNKILGALLRAATFPTGASRNSSYGDLSLKVDNVEVAYSGVDWESLQGEIGRRLPDALGYPAHHHTENTAAAYTQDADTLGGNIDAALLQQYGYLDLDPLGDESYALDTTGAAKIALAVDSDVTDVNPSYALPVELVEVSPAAAA